jgi:16S rRNA (guanine527-N7)-methyltransferase
LDDPTFNFLSHTDISHRLASTTLVLLTRPGINSSMTENMENLSDRTDDSDPDTDENGETFEQALARYGMELDEPLAHSLKTYAQTMWRFNEQLNLTRHTTWDLFVGRDLRDCLQLAHLIQPDEEILDLGSGNGVPGIPLAIIRPDIEVSLAESVGKRAKVLDELVTELNLNVPVYASRGEHLLEDFRFSTIVSRAVGSLLKFCRWVEPHWSGFDRLLLVKGPKWIEERGEARHHGALKGLDLRVVASYPLGNPLEIESGQNDDPKTEPQEPNAAEADSTEGDQPDAPALTATPAPADTPSPADTSPGEGVILQLSRKGRFA